MRTWHFYDAATGDFVGRTFSGDEGYLPANTPPGCAAYAADSAVDYLRHKVVDGNLAPRQRPLADLKSELWEDIKAQRDLTQYGGFDTPYGRFDSTLSAQSSIQWEVQAAKELGVEFSTEWTLQDNGAVRLNDQQMIEVGLLLRAHKNAVHERARRLRAQINAAGPDELADIVWTFP